MNVNETDLSPLIAHANTHRKKLGMMKSVRSQKAKKSAELFVVCDLVIVQSSTIFWRLLVDTVQAESDLLIVTSRKLSL